MLSLHAGYDVAYLTDEVSGHGADYYLSATEAAGNRRSSGWGRARKRPAWAGM